MTVPRRLVPLVALASVAAGVFLGLRFYEFLIGA